MKPVWYEEDILKFLHRYEEISVIEKEHDVWSILLHEFKLERIVQQIVVSVSEASEVRTKSKYRLLLYMSFR